MTSLSRKGTDSLIVVFVSKEGGRVGNEERVPVGLSLPSELALVLYLLPGEVVGLFSICSRHHASAIFSLPGIRLP